MYRKLTLALVLALPLLASPLTAAAEDLPPVVNWIPDDAILVLDVSRPMTLLEPLLADEVAGAVSELPVYQDQASKPGFKQFTGVVKFLELSLNTDWRAALQTLTGEGVTVAVCPHDTVLLFIDTQDAEMLEKLHKIFLNFAQTDAEKQGKPERVASTEYRGVKGWTFNGEEAHAIIGSRLILSNRPEGLKAVLDCRAEGKTKSLAAVPNFRAAQRATGPEPAAMAFVNWQVLKSLPKISQGLKLDRQNPLAALLFAGLSEAASASNWLALGMDVEDGTLVLRASTDGNIAEGNGPAAFAVPANPGEGAPPNLVVPRRIAALSFYRDLHRFYAAKDDLFPERTSGLIFFENMMGIFFSGRDLTEDVLGHTKPEVRFVVAGQDYDPAIGTPQMKLPAFAAVLRVRDATAFDEMVEEAWQKAVGLTSFTRGQQAQAGLIIDRVVQGDTKFTVAYFSAAEVEDRANLPERFNFRPALALPDDYVIFSSTEGLARDLIDALAREKQTPTKRTAAVDSLVEIEGDQLAAILQSNRQALIQKNMVEEGNSLEEAETAIGLLLTVVDTVEHVKLIVGTHGGLTKARLEAKFKLP